MSEIRRERVRVVRTRNDLCKLLVRGGLRFRVRSPAAAAAASQLPLIVGGRCLPQPRFRSMWERYCRGVQAIVYVVDSADVEVPPCPLFRTPFPALSPLLLLPHRCCSNIPALSVSNAVSFTCMRRGIIFTIVS